MNDWLAATSEQAARRHKEPAMRDMRAKVRVANVQQARNNEDAVAQENLTFNAVGDSKYPADGSSENNNYARWTPNAEFKMTINNPALFGKFEVGHEYYVDFTRAAQ